MKENSNDFWTYSLRTYQQPQVQTLCLKLQDEWGLDVNVFLYCSWAANAGFALSADDVNEAIRLSAQWSTLTVAPLRTIRRQMKQAELSQVPETVSERIRQSVKALELECEQVQQQALQAALKNSGLVATSDGDIAAMIARNTQLYFELAGVSTGMEQDGALSCSLHAALPLLRYRY